MHIFLHTDFVPQVANEKGMKSSVKFFLVVLMERKLTIFSKSVDGNFSEIRSKIKVICRSIH